MVQKRPKDYIEFHEGEKEFCPESGPLVIKKIKAPSAVMKALVLSLVTAATVYAIATMPIFTLIPSIKVVTENTAVIETKFEGLPENAEITYTVAKEETSNNIIINGSVETTHKTIELVNLEPDTEYRVSFFMLENQKSSYIKSVSFRTKPNKVIEDPIVPQDPIVPENPIVPEVPEQPTEPEPPVSPVVPENPIIKIQVKGHEIVSAEAVKTNDEIVGYVVEETHVFGNVPSDAYEIVIHQNGEITTYQNVYDEATQTATITFVGNTIGLGETGTSEVVLTYKDGGRATSTHTVTTPKLNSVTLDVLDNGDGTFTYTVNGEGIEPSVGTIAVELNVYSDYYGLSNNPETQTEVVNNMAFNRSYVGSPIAPGETLTAVVEAGVVWSMDETNTEQVLEAEKEYAILSTPEVVESRIDGAEAVKTNDEIVGYVVEETHVFGNVPSDAYEIVIHQNGEITTYQNVYDEATQTATITFVGNTIGLGETGTSEVELTYKDGVRATSTNTVTTPKLNSVTLDVLDQHDGTYTYQMHAEGIEPTVGEVEVQVELDADNGKVSENPIVHSYTKDVMTFDEEYTCAVDVVGETLTALVNVNVVWSLDTTGSLQSKDASVEYEIPDVSEMTFTDIAEGGIGYIYTVNVKFANLENVIPQSIDFYRQSYNPIYGGEDVDSLFASYDTSQMVVEEGVITATLAITEDDAVSRDGEGHRWTAVLTYLNHLNETQTIEIANYIEPISMSFNHLNSIMWQENGYTYADYEFVFAISETYSPKGITLVKSNTLYWEIISSELEVTDTHGFIKGQMRTDQEEQLSYNAYLDWLATPEEESIYTGCSGGNYIISSLTNQTIVPNSSNTGYDSVSEEFTFENGTDLLNAYSTQYVLVTLADGSQIKVTQDAPDESGVVSVNWNSSNNVVVTVNQSSVSLGQTTIVDLVDESVRTEDMMLGMIVNYTYRCFSNYE